ncbi:MAG: nicotinate mononucleotide-dependent phosphoribosyltransferase CobT [Cyanobacteria bacterium P01_D01_bin.36]
MIRICAGSRQATETAENWLARYQGHRPTFACILSFTETGLRPHISAAGNTIADRRRTAAIDGEFLLSNEPSIPQLPPLAAGISPAVISRAVLRSLSIPVQLLSTGLPVALSVPYTRLPQVQAHSVETGCAMSLAQADALFAAGQVWGAQLATANGYLILAECVVGGTTTAQAVLTALGYSVDGSMSSSHRVGNHRQKQALIAAGLAAWQEQIYVDAYPSTDSTEDSTEGGLTGASASRQKMNSAIGAAAAVGDPMQLVVAGMMISASRVGGVLLAGGAQMLAVYALARAIAQQKSLIWRTQRVIVGTTRWVVEDSHANTVQIAQQINAPYIASQIDFSQSPYVQLRAYEQGFVKEGMGAGGCGIAAHLYKGWTRSQLRHAVEAQLRHAF